MHGERLLPELIKNRLLNKLSWGSEPHVLHLLHSYAPGLRDHAAVEKAAIRVERISAPILLLSGNDDQMWPGTEMAEALMRRRTEAGRSEDRHRSFADCGHFIRPPITPTTVTSTEGVELGGTPEGCARASAEGWRETLVFLGERLRT